MLPYDRAIPPYEPPPSGDLADYERQIDGCQRCPLGASRTRFVFGEGPSGSALMLIGEAPGFQEDRQGRPFVGPSGRLLNRLLEAAGLERGQVYITNTVKCRPPGNRDPREEEIGTCAPYLAHQIRLVRPRLLVALGKVAGNALTATRLPLKAMRVKSWTYQGVEMEVTYHPAALLRNEAYIEPTREDFERFRKRYLR